MKNILAIIIFLSFFSFSKDLFAANYGKSYLDRVFILGISAFAADDFDKINKKYFSESIISKYKKKGYTVTCIIKGSPAEKAGLQFYDNIIGIDNDKFFYIWFADDQEVNLTIQRNGKIITKKIKPVKDSLIIKNPLFCNQENKIYECGHLAFEKNSQALAFSKIYECSEKNKSSLIPFLQKEDLLMFESFSWTFWDSAWKLKDPKKINIILPKADSYISIVKKYLNENTLSEKIRENLHKSINRIDQSIAYADKYLVQKNLKKSTNKITINKSDINRFKERVENIINNKSFDDAGSKYIFKYNSDYLIENGEIDFVQKNWKIAIDNIDWSKSENLNNIDIIISYAQSFNVQQNYFKCYQILENALSKINYFDKKNQDFLIAKRKIYVAQFFSLYNSINNFDKGKKEIEIVINKLKTILNEFNNFSEESKNQITKKDQNFYYNTYLALSNSPFVLGKNFEDTLKYTSLSISEINKDSRFHESINLTMIYQRITANSSLGNFDEVVSDYYLYKNIANKHIHTDTGKKNASYSAPGLAYQLYVLGLYDESQQILNFIDQYIDYPTNIIKTNQVQIHLATLAQAGIWMSQNHYTKAIDLLKKNYKQCDITKTGEYYSCLIFFKLLESYYQTNQIVKFEDTYKDILKIHPYQDDIDQVIKFALTSSPDNTAGLYIVMMKYYKNKNLKKNYDVLGKNSIKYASHALETKNLITHRAFTSQIAIYENLAILGKYLFENDISEGIEILDLIRNPIRNHYQQNIFQSYLSPKYKAYKILDAYFQVSQKYGGYNGNNFVKASYELSQLIRNSITAKEIQRSMIKRDIKDSTTFKLINDYQKLQIELASYYKNEEYNIELQSSKNISNQKFFKSFKSTEKIRSEIEELSKKISKEFPDYYKLIKPSSVGLDVLQNFLKKDEAILDYFFSNEKVYVFAIRKDKHQLFSANLSLDEGIKLENSIRKSLTLDVDGKLLKFDVKSSYELYQKIFQPTEQFINNVKHLYIVPDGAIKSIPLHMLSTDNEANCSNCANINWLMNRYEFSYLPSVEFIKNIKITKPQNFMDGLLKQAQLLLNPPVASEDKLQSENIYLGIGDPVFDKKKHNSSESKKDLLAFLFQRGGVIANTDQIKKLYGSVPGSDDEIKKVANFFTKEKSVVLLKKDATETSLKKLNIANFKVIHFATHGETSGAIKGYNEPFLVLTPPDIGTKEDDGILTMSEVMLLDNNADLIILSACNTAMGENKDSDGFSGLAKAFLYSGSKSVFVSNWYVETYAAKELTIKMVSKIINNKMQASEALNQTMKEFILENPTKTHPFFWAPFVMVGKNITL